MSVPSETALEEVCQVAMMHTYSCCSPHSMLLDPRARSTSLSSLLSAQMSLRKALAAHTSALSFHRLTRLKATAHSSMLSPQRVAASCPALSVRPVSAPSLGKKKRGAGRQAAQRLSQVQPCFLTSSFAVQHTLSLLQVCRHAYKNIVQNASSSATLIPKWPPSSILEC